MKRLAIIALTCLSAGVMYGQESNPSGRPEIVEGVDVGNTSAYTPAGELPGQEIGGSGYAPISADKTPPVMTQENVNDAVTVQSNDDDLTFPEAATEQQKKNARELHEKDSFGGALTLMSMGVVILVLAVLSILFLLFGKISSSLQERRKHQTSPVAARTGGADSGEAIAAIAAAMAEHFSGKHDMEDTILTIKRMRRAYSPWNSKIYNIRVAPEIHKN